MIVKSIKISDLKQRPYNPASRVSNKGRIAYLAKSIEKIGLVYPISITKSNEVIDGHRRIAAYKSLGLTEIPCLITATEDVDVTFAEVNSSTLTIKSTENLHIWLKNPNAVTERVRIQFERMEAAVGRPTVVKMSKAGAGVVTYNVAKRAAEYVGVEDEAFVKKIITWMINHSMQGTTREAMFRGVSPKSLKNAIENNKELKLRVVGR